MKVLSLFSGGGLGDFGLMAAGMEISGQVEIDEYCQKILALRYPDSVKWKDIRSVTGAEIKEKLGTIDLVAGGFPCQPYSVAGNKRGVEDDRHLWPEMRRIISEVRPAWVIGENVPGIIGIALDDVLADLEFLGYEATTIVFPAHAVGAPHRRDRIWIIANARHTESSGRKESKKRSKRKTRSQSSPHISFVANSIVQRRRDTEGNGEYAKSSGRYKSCSNGWWDIEPPVGRVANGVSRRVDRLKLLGNGQVVYCTKFIGEQIMQFEKNNKNKEKRCKPKK